MLACTQVKYQDVLLRRDLTQRMCAQLAPPRPLHTPTTPPTHHPGSPTPLSNTPLSTTAPTQHTPLGDGSTPLGSGSTPSNTTSALSSPGQLGSVRGAAPHGHWSGRLSLLDVARLNEQAGQLFEAGRVEEYRSMVRQLAAEGLMTQVCVGVRVRV